jgi:hypothetical protein
MILSLLSPAIVFLGFPLLVAALLALDWLMDGDKSIISKFLNVDDSE